MGSHARPLALIFVSQQFRTLFALIRMKPSLLSRFLNRALLFLLIGASLSLHGQLVWDPDAGWQLQPEFANGERAELPQSRGLILMTMAREAQENGHTGLALRYYKDV